MSEALFTAACLVYCLIGLAFVLVDVPDVPGQSDAEILTRWLLVALFWPVVAIWKVSSRYKETGQMTQLQLYAGAQVFTAVDGPCPRRITRACYVWAHNKAEAVGLMIADAQREFSEDYYSDHNVALTAVDGVTKTAEEVGQ